ncbi:MAG: transcriptional repressor [Acholeplasmataceae bacterium]|jgi:Fur family ferric uptake transcriptional regulator/Fur family peroxide stress response transcriptional regulator
MDLKERYFQKIRNDKMRLTKSRKAMIEILENQHLTFKEIQKALAQRGFYNVSTIYNNLEFLIDQKIVVEIYINDTKYYDLAMGNPMHNADSHIHIMNRDTNEITEVNSPDIFEYISKHPSFKDLDLDYIRITISASGKKR